MNQRGLRSVASAYATEGQGVTPLAAAIEGGYMREGGLDVTIAKLGSATAVTRALVEGSVLFGNLAAPALVHSVARGAELGFVVGGVNQQFLAARPGVAKLEEVQNGLLGASRPGDLSEFLCRFLIDRELTGATVAYLGGTTDRVEALVAGRVDAIPLSPPAAIAALDSGCEWILDFGAYGLNFAIGGIAVTRGLLATDGHLVEIFLRAYLAGQARYKADREFGIAVHQKYGEVERSVAERTYDVTRAGFRDLPDPATEGLSLLVEFLKSRGDIPSELTMEQVTDPTLIRRICNAG